MHGFPMESARTGGSEARAAQRTVGGSAGAKSCPLSSGAVATTLQPGLAEGTGNGVVGGDLGTNCRKRWIGGGWSEADPGVAPADTTRQLLSPGIEGDAADPELLVLDV